MSKQKRSKIRKIYCKCCKVFIASPSEEFPLLCEPCSLQIMKYEQEYSGSAYESIPLKFKPMD